MMLLLGLAVISGLFCPQSHGYTWPTPYSARQRRWICHWPFAKGPSFSACQTTPGPCAAREGCCALRARSDEGGDLEIEVTALRFSADTSRQLVNTICHAEEAHQSPLAVFDADGTLWRNDACLAYMDDMIQPNNLWEDKGNILLQYEKLLVTKGKDVAYGYCCQLFEGMDLDSIHSTTTLSFEQFVKQHVFEGMRALVTLLRSRGWTVRIVTASPTWVVVPGALWLGLRAEDVIGIDVEVEAGVATDRLKYPLSWGEGKRTCLVTRVPEPAPSIVAGNSLDDFALLEYCDPGPRGFRLFIDSRSIFGYEECVQQARKRSYIVHTPESIAVGA